MEGINETKKGSFIWRDDKEERVNNDVFVACGNKVTRGVHI
jgi:hypothetical protein